MKRVILTLALATLCIPAGAYPDFFGSTGLVQVPTADTVEPGVYELAFDYADLDTQNRTGWVGRLLAGTSEKAELGAAYVLARGTTSGHITSLSGKVALRKEPADPFSLAVGMSFRNLSGDIFDAMDRAIKLYGVITKDLTETLEQGAPEEPPTLVRGHVGLAYTRLSGTNSSKMLRPFAGVEFVRRNGAALVLEWEASRWGSDVTSVALRTPLRKDLMAQFGVTNNLGGLDFSGTHGLFVGGVYRFGEQYR